MVSDPSYLTVAETVCDTTELPRRTLSPWKTWLRRGRKWLGWFRQFGLIGTVRYTVWELLSYPRFTWFHPWRSGVLAICSQVFRFLRMRSIPVAVNDVRLYIDPRTPWALRVYYFSPRYDLEEISAVKMTVPERYTFVDIGANFGVWSFSLAKHFQRVLAVEPHPQCYACCLQAVRHLQCDHVTVANVALAEQDSDGLFFPLASNPADGRIVHPGDPGRGEGIPVKLMSFDSLATASCLDVRCLFIKLDAQGAEPRIMSGMQQTLTCSEDLILYIEVTEPTLRVMGSSVADLFTLLKALGFLPVEFWKGLTPLGWEAVDKAYVNSKNCCFRRDRRRGTRS